VLSYLCAGRPILLSINSDNPAATIIRDQRAGLVVPPEDRRGLISAAQELYESPDLREKMASNGRRYAEQTFDLDSIAARMEYVLTETVLGASGGQPAQN
jgi:glycosyltransferase involved in cell wall biosynthesis